MKKIIFACLIGIASTAAVATSASAMHAVNHTKYCRNYAMDPICMSPKMLKMRMGMMQMTKAKAMSGRTKYCRNATYGDPICKKQMMNSTLGY
jgi:hypothetical protein